VSTQSWITLVSCIGEVALVVLVCLRALRSVLAVPLLLLSIDLAGWNFAQLAWQRSGSVEWHLIDMVASPLGTALAFQFMLAFLGQSRQLRWMLHAAFAIFGVLAFIPAAAQFSAIMRGLAFSRVWSVPFLIGLLLFSAIVTVLLVSHLRRVARAEERQRTWLVLAGVVVISPLAATEIWADIGFHVPRMGSIGIFGFNAILMTAAFRFRLLDRALSPVTALSALVLGALGAAAYLTVFRLFGSHTALLVFGTVVVTLMMLAAGRLVAVMILARRDQVLRLATLGRFAAQLGHDLRNPLAALKGATQFLREERRQGRSIDDRTEFLDLLRDQIDRLLGVVEDYQRLGRIEPVRSPVQLNDVVRQLVALEAFASGDRISVRAELSPDLPACHIDRDLVAGALENLLQNAFEAIPAAGAVVVRTNCVNEARRLFVSVEDTGVGMSSRTRERALDDFFTTKAGGSGLGLAFVRRVAEVHQGDITLASREGRGTTVTLSLPIE
jgi:signal transduction histidine kinase